MKKAPVITQVTVIVSLTTITLYALHLGYDSYLLFAAFTILGGILGVTVPSLVKSFTSKSKPK